MIAYIAGALPGAASGDPGAAPGSFPGAADARPLVADAWGHPAPATATRLTPASVAASAWKARGSSAPEAAQRTLPAPSTNASAALRWRTRDGQPEEITSTPAIRPPGLVWRETHGADEATGVVAASYQAELGLRGAALGEHRQAARTVAQVAAELELTPASGTVQVLAGQDASGVTLAPATTTLPLQPPQPSTEPSDPAPQPPLGEIDRGPRTVAPLTTNGDSPEKPCTRIYGDPGRNCCEEERACRNALQTLRDTPITKISLDITAPFMPDAKTEQQELESRTDRIGQMPARVWHDRSGGVLADGRLVDIAFRKIVVEGRDGAQQEIPLGQLSDDDLCFLAAWWKVPTECSLSDEMYAGRSWQPITMTWKASAVCHKPLYFEEVQLERYGHTMGPLFQPVVSGAHFFLNIAALPYQMGIHPPNECRYALGYYRPGSCAPWLLPPVPISLRGGLAQAGAVVGVVALFP